MTTYAALEILAQQQERAVAETAEALAQRDGLRSRLRVPIVRIRAAEQRLAAARLAEEAARQAQRAALRTTVAVVDPSVPLLLLPVRLETRYQGLPGGKTQLRIRVYPDDVHYHAHEPALTPGELAAGTVYWQEIWSAPARADRMTAWKMLVTTVGPLRAAWVARVLTPVSPPGAGQPLVLPSPATQAGRWMRPAQARLMPDRWVAHAFRGGQRIATAEGDLVRRPLAFGPDPMDGTGALVDPGMLWMTDFAEAVRVGMALVMDLPDRGRIDLLTVIGVRGTESPSEGSQAVNDLLVGQRYSAGLDLVSQGAPTNNTAAAPSSHGAPDPTGSASFVDPTKPPVLPAAGDGGDADLVARALGIPLEPLRDLPHAGQRGVALERDMAVVLWPGTWGYYLTQMLRLDAFDQAGAGWRRWVLDTVRAAGPLPVLRVADQPYGLLPVTALRAWRPAPAPALVVAETLRSARGSRQRLRTTLRVLGGLDSRGGWTFQPDRTFVVPAPEDASAVTIASGDLDGDGLPELVVGHASAAEWAAEGVRFTIMRLLQDQVVLTGNMTVRAPQSRIPDAVPSGVAVALGRLPSPGRTNGPAANDVVAIVQCATPRGESQVLLYIGLGLTADGAVEAWAPAVDVSSQFEPAERIQAATLVPGSRDSVDLVVISSAGANPLAWRVARGLTADGVVTGGWSDSVPVGTTASPDITLAGVSVAVADLARDGSLQGLLAQFWSHPDGSSSSSYTVGRDPVAGVFGTWADFYNLGSSGAVGTTALVGAGATWVPWTPFRDTAPGLGSASRGVNLLERLVAHWQGGLGGVARVRPGDPAPGRTLLDLLTADATSSSYDARAFVGSTVLSNVWHLLGQPASGSPAQARVTIEALLEQLGLPASRLPRLAAGGYAETATPIADPLVAPASELGDAPVKWLAEMADATPLQLHAQWTGKGVPLLARLVRHSLLQAYADAAFALVPVPSADPAPLPEPELIDLADVTATDPTTPVRTLTSWRHLSASLYQGRPVAQVIYEAARAPDPVPEVHPVTEVLASLARLAAVPSRDLERLAAGALDLATHRLDAWITALATQRLTELRAQSPVGVQTGGYGFVCDLEPSTSSPSTGYVHTPSMLHAATAAVLRSGFLTHGGEQLAVDLSSTRVRGALTVLEAVRQGQSLGAALGYRLERALVDGGAAQYLDLFRQLAPQDVGVVSPVPEGADVRATAAMVTIDGLALLRMMTDGTLPWGAVPSGQTHRLPAVGSTDHAALSAALQAMRDAADAIADIGIAESVHQSVQRNPIRAAGTLDALSRGSVPPPENPEVLLTPRTGTGVTHRLLVAVPDPGSPAASAALARWTATPAQRTRHVRAVAEPRLNAWAALMLGDPARVRFAVGHRDAAGDPVGDPTVLTLAEVGLCPLDLLGASSPGVSSLAETNLGRRLLQHAETLSPVSGSATTVELRCERGPRWAAEDLTLPEFLTVAESARNLVMGARAANRQDLTLGERSPTGVDEHELGGRAAAAAAALTGAVQGLRAFFAISPAQRATLAGLFPGIAGALAQITSLLDLPLFCDIALASAAVDRPAGLSLDAVADALELVAAFGVSGAAPQPRTGDLERDRSALAAQARAVAIAATRRVDTASAALDDRSRLEAVFGDGFRALPLFTAGLALPPTRPQGADDAAVDRWFHGAARVREPAARLQDLLLAGELTAGASSGWQVMQRPTVPGTHWVGEAVQPAATPARIPAGVLSVAVATADPDWTGEGLIAALAVDAWVEVVPSALENTAVTFHVDAPSACAPQTALLAVHPDPARRWSDEILADLVAELSGLAALRAIDPELVPAMGHLLPAVLLANNAGGDPAGDTIATTTGG